MVKKTNDHNHDGEDIRCAFCGKTPDMVGAMISGPNGIYICDECISISADAMMRDMGLHATSSMPEGEPLPALHNSEDASAGVLDTLPTPHELYERLGEYVIGQEDAKKALMVFIATDTKGFAPAPGMLLNIISNAMQRKEMSGAEAWDYAKKAASRSLYFSGEEFRKLPPAVQAVVRSPDTLHQWASMDEWSLQHSVEPWFLRAYEDQIERECRLRLLPGE